MLFMPSTARRTSPKDRTVGARADLPPPIVPKEVQREVSREIAQRAKGKHGNAIEVANPTVVRQIIEGLADGKSQAELEAKFGYDRKTISKIFREYPDAIALVRENIAINAYMDEQQLAEVMRMKVDQMKQDPEQIAKTNIRDIAISVSMMNERYRNAVGENKVVIEHRSGPSIEEFAKVIEEARKKAQQKIVDVTPEPEQLPA